MIYVWEVHSLKCPCHNETVDVVEKDTIEVGGTLTMCEAEIWCHIDKKMINYWSYGSLMEYWEPEPPKPLTGYQLCGVESKTKDEFPF